MKLLTPSQARELDKISMGEMGISGETLMGNAGEAVANFAIDLLKNVQSPSIFILCGKGNNGGDGFAAASILHNNNLNVTIQSIPNKSEIMGDSLIYYLKCESDNINILYGDSVLDIQPPDLIIDCLFGTGLKGQLKENYLPLINWMNQSNVPILSVDIASGLDGNSGCVAPMAVKASHTISFEGLKLGSVFRQGPEYSGNATCVDIGFPNIQLSGLNWECVTPKIVEKSLTKPLLDTHKYSSGKVLVIAGSQGMTGAAILCTYGALRSGAGLTITTSPSNLNDIYERSIVEGMTFALESTDGILSDKHLVEILEKSHWADAVILGPGMGRHLDTQNLIKRLILKIEKPLVLDADGLFPFKENISALNEREFPLIITPHLGELSHLTGIDKDTILHNFPSVMTDFMEHFSHTALVKQVPSCIFIDRSVYVNSTGNPGLATGGTGDVLSGMIGSFITQGMSLETAGVVGAFIHGEASDRLVKLKGYRGQVASDLLDEIPKVISTYEAS